MEQRRFFRQSAAVSVVLALCSGLAGLGLGVVLAYQLAWTGLTVAMPMLKRPGRAERSLHCGKQ